jgi:hypothetical protein
LYDGIAARRFYVEVIHAGVYAQVGREVAVSGIGYDFAAGAHHHIHRRGVGRTVQHVEIDFGRVGGCFPRIGVGDEGERRSHVAHDTGSRDGVGFARFEGHRKGCNRVHDRGAARRGHGHREADTGGQIEERRSRTKGEIIERFQAVHVDVYGRIGRIVDDLYPGRLRGCRSGKQQKGGKKGK